jgi:23S rRNA (cytosine1962-C5)-methyltransferase
MNTFHLDKCLVLKKNEDRRVVAGHPWIFSNEIREIKGEPTIGDVVELRAASGLSLGVGFYNPHSLIAFRMLSRKIEEEINYSFFEQRIRAALELRRLLFPHTESFRIVHGEADFLPGLIVDKYNDLLAIQTHAFGMDSRLPWICDALESLLKPRGIVERNESSIRSLEQLEPRKGMLRGAESSTLINEHGLSYAVDLLHGQKTGFFLDQRENRFAVRQFADSSSVLDCFCNDGGFSLNAAIAGAGSVIGVDVSSDAIIRAQHNASLNSLGNVQFEHDDVFEKLNALGKSGALFDVIVLDPPSFTKNRKTVPTAKKGYKDLHARALRVLRKGGILLTASCSHHIDPDVFLSIVDESARKSGRHLQMLEWRGAGPDHPSLPAVPETRYLKFGVFRVS